MTTATGSSYQAVTCNACNLCTPLGACLVFRGVQGAIPYLHGSQGCSTYIRRYLIGHFREPIDIASSNFSESAAVYGGSTNFRTGLANVIGQYRPELVGVSTTCLSETIGDDINLYLHELYREMPKESLPPIVHVSTPSYQGTHADGFHRAVRALVEQLAEESSAQDCVNLFPGMVSPADLRHLQEVIRDYGLEPICVPDYSETLDGGVWDDYCRLPPGGTSVANLRRTGGARASLELGSTLPANETAGAVLERKYGVACHRGSLPIGIRASDAFFEALERLSDRPRPTQHAAERGRLVDAYVDGHKYVAGKRAVVLGDEDFVVALASFLSEIGVQPVVCASGGSSGRLEKALHRDTPCLKDQPLVLQDSDYASIEEATRAAAPDIIVGTSKAYTMARNLNLPLLRVGFPIHDRIGGARMLHVGYRGTQNLFDQIVNMFIEVKQSNNPVGYMNM